MNIKPQLLSEAQRIVDSSRSSGSSINDVIAKHASEKGLKAPAVRSLTALVNRCAFKQAMAAERRDEFELADPELVLHRMAPTKSASQIKSASVGLPGLLDAPSAVHGSGMGRRSMKLDYGPALRRKLDQMKIGLDGEIRLGMAKMSSAQLVLDRLAPSVKRVGLDASPFFKEAFEKMPEEVRVVLEGAFSDSPTEKLAFTEAQTRNLLPRALSEFAEMAKAAAVIVSEGQVVAERQDTRRRVVDTMGTLRNGLEV